MERWVVIYFMELDVVRVLPIDEALHNVIMNIADDYIEIGVL